MNPFTCSSTACDLFKLTLTAHCYDPAAHLALELLLVLEEAIQMACMLAYIPYGSDSQPCPSKALMSPVLLFSPGLIT